MNDLRRTSLNVDVDISYIFDILVEYIEDSESSDYILKLSKWLVQEIEAYGGSESGVINIVESIKVLKGVK